MIIGEKLSNFLRLGVITGLVILAVGLVLRFIDINLGYYLENAGFMVIIGTPISFLAILSVKGLRGEDKRIGFLALAMLSIMALSVFVSLR